MAGEISVSTKAIETIVNMLQALKTPIDGRASIPDVGEAPQAFAELAREIQGLDESLIELIDETIAFFTYTKDVYEATDAMIAAIISIMGDPLETSS